MIQYLPFLMCLVACSPQAMKAADDIMEGEVKVIETGIEDLSPQVPHPAVGVTVKKF